jgi:ubiquinone/menaquinone biosynthesis C-methylase UbiE
MNVLSASVEAAVRARYTAGAHEQQPALCCPVDYDPKNLKVIPREVIERDYGCGDPSRHVRRGETVLDLGSGTGMICFIAAQVVGAEGRVIGVDMTDAMLEVARRNAPVVAERIGYANVEFRKGRIQDLALDVEEFDAERSKHPGNVEALADELRAKRPLIATESIDVVVSNCVLNLIDPDAKQQLFAEIFRVLRRSGRAVISDIVADEEVPAELKSDAELWSGCVSGALTEDEFVRGFEQSGFRTVRIIERSTEPWRVLNGIGFRSVTVEAWKDKPDVSNCCCPDGAC